MDTISFTDPLLFRMFSKSKLQRHSVIVFAFTTRTHMGLLVVYNRFSGFSRGDSHLIVGDLKVQC